MKRSQLVFIIVLLIGLLAVGMAVHAPTSYGAVPWFGWVGFILLRNFMALGLVFYDTGHRKSRVLSLLLAAKAAALATPEAKTATPQTLDPDGPPYPHPVINSATCIGCHACVEACPHDVLAIVNGISTPVALDQCMEDTSCQVECPTSPKSCIVVNTTKTIPERKVPNRDQKFMTNVPGVYLIGDVSGVPLIKNAINEGGAVIDHIVEDLKREGSNAAADFDVVIVGIGPAGLSAVALAKQRGLKYAAIEQDQVVATIQAYPAGKYVFFKPDTVDTAGGIALPGPGGVKEQMIKSWIDTMMSHQLKINEFESCKSVKKDGDIWVVSTELDKTKEKVQYRTRRVILAIGNRGTPMRLRVPGEEIRMTITPTEPTLPTFCNKCGTKRQGGDSDVCVKCGQKLNARVRAPYQDDKVKYKLSDPNDYKGKHCVVVGAGNSAIEAAVDLAAFRSADGTKITGWRDNTVSLVIRSDFKGDLKLGNKMLCYECIDEGKIKVYFRATIKEITDSEVALMDARERDPKTAKDKARFKNDYIFALIGGDKPTKFLETIGIKIG